jgi:hypothetical protein
MSEVSDMSTRDVAGTRNIRLMDNSELIASELNLNVKKSFKKIIVSYINKVDEDLFHLSDNAETNNKQAEIFAVLREFRKKKIEIESELIQSLTTFHVLTPISIKKDEEVQEKVRKAHLELVDEHVLELDIAFHRLVERIEEKCGENLVNFTGYFNYFCEHAYGDYKTNPISPLQIAIALNESVSQLDLSSEYIHLFFKAFEQDCVDRINDVYQCAITAFSSSKVSEDEVEEYITAQREKNRQSQAPSEGQNLGNEINENVSQELSETLELDDSSDLNFANSPLAPDSQQLTSGPTAVSEPKHDLVYQTVAENLQFNNRHANLSLGQYTSQFEQAADNNFVELATLLDMKKGQVPYGIAEPIITAQQLVKNLHQLQAIYIDNFGDKGLSSIRKLLSEKMPSGTQADQSTIGRFNDDMIDIISMIFDFILDDRALSPQIKSQLSRLQVPFLKVALIDKTFFKEKEHSARKLLNEMAHAAIAIGPNPTIHDQLLVDKILEIVETVLASFEDDLSLFDELLIEFSEFRQEEHRRANMITERTKQAQKGKAIHEKAQRVTKIAIQKLQDRHGFSANIHKVLLEGIQPTLVLYYLKEDSQRIQFFETLKLAHEIVLSSQPKSHDKMRELWSKKLPHIRERFKEAAAKSCYNSIKIDELVSILEEEQTSAMAGNAAPVLEAPVFLDEKQRIQDAEVSEDVKELVKSIQVGQWLEVNRDGKWLRGQLITRLVETESLLFVNRVGMKVAELTEFEFAQMIANSQVKFVKEGQLFDNAVVSIIDRLKISEPAIEQAV